MKLLYCWRCHAQVPMMNEAEFREVQGAYRTALQGIKSYRQRHNVGIEDTPVARFHRPVHAAYHRLAKAAGFDAPLVSVHHVLKHRLASYGPACGRCGLPLRTPDARRCAACGAKRAA